MYRLRLILDNVSAVISARWQLRYAVLSSRVRVWGRVIVKAPGELTIGDRCRIEARAAPIELGVASGATLTIGARTFINYGTSIGATKRIEIGEDCLIGTHVMIVDNDFHRLEPDRRLEQPDAEQVIIGNNVWIGARAIVLKGVSIGDNSVIGAASLVTGDVPANTVHAGSPARHIRDL